MTPTFPTQLHAELAAGMALAKCHKCGCMHDALDTLVAALPGLPHAEQQALSPALESWHSDLESVQYTCLGCAHCYPAVALNHFHAAYPHAAPVTLGCAFEVQMDHWPPVPGEYSILGTDPNRTIAISTLGSPELTEHLAAANPPRVCIIGKTETENIGLDKVIKNMATHPSLRYLVLTGHDPAGHFPGATLRALHQNGIDARQRVIGAPGKRPVLKNVSPADIATFRERIQLIDLMGCEDVAQILEAITALPEQEASSCGCGSNCSSEVEVTSPVITLDAIAMPRPPVLRAEEPEHVEMDRAGYFVILLQRDQGQILVEHYAYDHQLLHVITGQTARSLYMTIIAHAWVSQLSHAAYLGKELARAEACLHSGENFIQDGA